jgi:uncharacterized caspase-like protein
VTGASALARKGSAYVVAVGVNAYDNPEFNLRYAAPDADLVARGLATHFTRLGSYTKVTPVSLTNERATRRNMLHALQRLAGDTPRVDPTVAGDLDQLKRAAPEDTVIVYFAGHGGTAGTRYFLLPHDTGYRGSRRNLDPAAWDGLLANGISDRDLNEALERIDSAHLMLIIDACYSGRLLESEEARRGPLNARGIAQLAYEKGAYVLAASQSNQAALEFQRLGHGILTYTLIEKGLNAFGSDTNGDGRITAGEWLRYAGEQVPIEQTSLASVLSASGRLLRSSGRLVSVAGEPVTTQRPRSYFRRDRADDWLITSRAP